MATSPRHGHDTADSSPAHLAGSTPRGGRSSGARRSSGPSDAAAGGGIATAPIGTVDLIRPRLSQGMLVSGEPGAKKVRPLPYGMTRELRLGTKQKRPWQIVQRDGILFARLTDSVESNDVNLSTEYWHPRNRSSKVPLRFRLTSDDSMLIEARQLLERSHPHRSPPSGVYLVCSFVDPSLQEKMRRKAQRGDPGDLWSSAWWEPAGHAVGCVVFSQLFHGSPRGRDAIASDAGISVRKMRKWKTRSEIVRGLGVMWLSRIAVDAPYRGCGIGTALATEALQVAAERLLWQPDYLEVIRTVPATVTQAGESGYEDFLTHAGYNLVANPVRSPPIRQLSQDGSRTDSTERCRRLYYWSRVPRT